MARRATGFDHRGSNDFRPSRLIPKLESHKLSTSALVADAGKYFECAEIAETQEDHIIPRQSLTNQLHLRLFPITFETEQRNAKQRNKVDGKLVATTDNRVIWKSDRTLLRTNKPEATIPVFVRETSYSKRKRLEKEIPACIEAPQIPDDI